MYSPPPYCDQHHHRLSSQAFCSKSTLICIPHSGESIAFPAFRTNFLPFHLSPPAPFSYQPLPLACLQEPTRTTTTNNDDLSMGAVIIAAIACFHQIASALPTFLGLLIPVANVRNALEHIPVRSVYLAHSSTNIRFELAAQLLFDCPTYL
jgi:hypothetical protein